LPSIYLGDGSPLTFAHIFRAAEWTVNSANSIFANLAQKIEPTLADVSESHSIIQEGPNFLRSDKQRHGAESAIRAPDSQISDSSAHCLPSSA
jgi:hypothetical protein